MPQFDRYDEAIEVLDTASMILVRHPVTGRVERTSPQRIVRAGLSPLGGQIDGLNNKIFNYDIDKPVKTGGHTFVSSDAGKTLVYTGPGNTWIVPNLVAIGVTSRSRAQLVRNRGTGSITLSPSGVVLRRSMDGSSPATMVVLAGRVASLEWEADATTAYCWVDGV